MSEHVQLAIADLVQKRDRLNETIAHLEWFVREFPHTAAAMTISRPARVERNHRPKKRALKERTNERTNERTQAPRQRAARSLPNVSDRGEQILAALRAGSPQSPSELAKRLKISRPLLTYRLKPLIKSGAVLATGATMNRQFSLAGKYAAKEVP